MEDEDRIRALAETAVTEHGAALKAYAIQLTQNIYDAEDLRQETFLRMWRTQKMIFAPPEVLRRWLFTVMRHLHNDWFDRRQIRAKLLSRYPLDVPKPSPCEFEQLETDEIVRRIAEAKSTLSPAVSEALHLYVQQNLSLRDMVAITGVSRSTLCDRVHKGLNTLRERMKTIST